MKPEGLELLQNFQEDLREMADQEKISYADESVYGMALMLESVLKEDMSAEDALNEFIANSDVEITADIEVVTE